MRRLFSRLLSAFCSPVLVAVGFVMRVPGAATAVDVDDPDCWVSVGDPGNAADTEVMTRRGSSVGEGGIGRLSLVLVASVLVFTLAASGAAFGGGITPIAQTREIMAHADYYTGDPISDSASDFLPFNSTVYDNAIGTCDYCDDAEAWAYQNSWFSSEAVQVDHSVWFGGYSVADSSFLLDFVLDEDLFYTLSWNLSVTGESEPSNVLLTNLDSGEVVFDIFTNGAYPPWQGGDSAECLDPDGYVLVPCVGTRSDMLTAATYRLTSDIGDMYYGSSATVSFLMEVVPEPSTALLLGCGLVGLALKRRRAV